MAKSILEIVFETIKQGQGGKQASAELRELKGTVGEVSSGLLGFNLASFSAAGAVLAVGGAVNAAITDYQAYAEAIRGMAAITGTGVEETSRLVQAFDDMGISQEKVAAVIESAAKKGFVMSIENVAKLADEYNNLSTKEDQNKLLTDKLGKAALDMSKAFEEGGEKIRDAAAAQADGLIVTEESIQKADELRIAQDNLNDSWGALSGTVAQIAIPILADWVENLNAAIENAQNATGEFQRMGQAGILSANEMYILSRSTRDAGKALLEYNSSNDAGIVKTNTMTAALNGAATGWSALPPNIQAYITKADEAAAATERMREPIQNVQQAMEDLDAARKSFGEGLAGQIRSQLESAGLSPEQLNQALVALDAQFGTTTFQQQQMQDWITNLVGRYSQGAGLGELQTGLGQISRYGQGFDPGILAAQGALQTSATAMLNIGTIYVGNEFDYQTLLARLRVDLPGLLR